MSGKTVGLNRPETFTEKVIALTFDDGPSPFTTPSILNALAQYNAKATFYMCGGMLRNREWIVRRVAADGHEIGNHSHSHKARPPESLAFREVDGVQQKLKGIVGYDPRTYRPPYGIENSSTTSRARHLRMPIVLWTADTLDWKLHSSGLVSSRAVAGMKPGGIILMHDIHEHTAQAVPAILAAAHARGYKCITVSEMLTKWQALADQEAAAKKAKAEAEAKTRASAAPGQK